MASRFLPWVSILTGPLHDPPRRNEIAGVAARAAQPGSSGVSARCSGRIDLYFRYAIVAVCCPAHARGRTFSLGRGHRARRRRVARQRVARGAGTRTRGTGDPQGARPRLPAVAARIRARRRADRAPSGHRRAAIRAGSGGQRGFDQHAVDAAGECRRAQRRRRRRRESSGRTRQDGPRLARGHRGCAHLLAAVAFRARCRRAGRAEPRRGRCAGAGFRVARRGWCDAEVAQ